jgi:4-aminobutyrate aminotransferase-like enzyme
MTTACELNHVKHREIYDFHTTFGAQALSKGDDRCAPVAKLPARWKTAFGRGRALVSLAFTGSDAIAQACWIADTSVQRRFAARRGRIITFEGAYCGSRGPLAHRSRDFSRSYLQLGASMLDADRAEGLIVDAPWDENYSAHWGAHYTEMSDHKDPVLLSPNEAACLCLIEATVQRHAGSSEPVAALVFEAVEHSAQRGMTPTFLHALTDTCARLGILTIEDACLTGVRCGGSGEDGSLFLGDSGAYHPDLVVFGKAFGVAGVLATKYAAELLCVPLTRCAGLVTSQCHASVLEDLLAKLRTFATPGFMRRIHEMGARICNVIRCKGAEARGVGLLIFTDAFISNAIFAFNRLLPVLDMDYAIENLLEVSRRRVSRCKAVATASKASCHLRKKRSREVCVAPSE